MGRSPSDSLQRMMPNMLVNLSIYPRALLRPDLLSLINCLLTYVCAYSLQERYRGEIEAMDADPYSLNFQLLLQARSHAERLDLFGGILGQERKRLAARATLQAMFSPDKGSESPDKGSESE